ncbi:ArnT family glycosyltransferase [Roseibium sp.]|uniref:ArnT family glycosyltransferase n=1 Tax=Roseibium sp. TaxID=1936156 RepID=UPI003A982F63
MQSATLFSRSSSPFYATPLGVWLIVAGWGLAHVLLRSLMSPVLGTDDMFENILVQELHAGYMLRQPPLYEWLLWSVQQVTGPVIWSFLLLKYGLISLSALFLFLIARRAIDDQRLAALCVFSYSLFYQFGWNLHEGVTHTVVLVTACSASAWTFLRALETRRLTFYVAFGIAAGAGLLAKHSYPLFVLALILAASSDREWRARIRPAGLLVAGLAAALVYSPYLHWIFSEGLGLMGEVANTMGVKDESFHLGRAATGLGKLGFGLIGFSVPLLPVVALLFWQRYAGGMKPREASVNGTARLCGRAVLFMIVLTAVLISVTGATYVKERHMHPLLLLLPIWMFADLARFEAGKRWRWLSLIVVAFAVVAFGARVPGLIAPDKMMCGGKCRHMKPYTGIKADLSAMGAERATLVVADEYTGGNLRVLFPEARIVSRGRVSPEGTRDVCLYVWEAGERNPARSATDDFVARTGAANTIGEPGRYVSAAWPHLWKAAGWRTTFWGVQPLPRGHVLCDQDPAIEGAR